MKNCSPVYVNLYIIRQKTGRQKILDQLVAVISECFVKFGSVYFLHMPTVAGFYVHSAVQKF
jgi:hypothetical protein